MKIYVGNLPYSINQDDLKELFTPFGEVLDVFIVMDRETRRSRGYGFVEMSDENAKKSIEELNGKEVGGRTIVVNEARPKN